MTFVAPIFLLAGVAAASAIVLLHFLARRRPRPSVFPTARFVPDRPARWPSPAPRPTDWLLLVLRVLAVVAIATGFAQPVRKPQRALATRVVLVDRSRSVAQPSAMRDSALGLLRDGDVLIPFDTTARVVPNGARDSAAALTVSAAPSSLSVALVVAERVTSTIRDRGDSIELVIVSPFASEAWDAATSRLRARWTGRARLVAVPLARGDTAAPRLDVRASAADPVAAAAAPVAARTTARTRVVRAVPTPSDSAWAAEAGQVLVYWPSSGASSETTAEAVVARGVVLAASLVRRTLGKAAARARVVARFADGAPAIVEHAHGDGCIREVAFDLPEVGDVPLRESTRRLVRVAGAPCEGNRERVALDAARLDSLSGGGPLLAASALPRPPHQRSPATGWLLIVAALLLLLEVGVRQRVVLA
jgi:hypothetical protein